MEKKSNELYVYTVYNKVSKKYTGWRISNATRDDTKGNV